MDQNIHLCTDCAHATQDPRLPMLCSVSRVNYVGVDMVDCLSCGLARIRYKGEMPTECTQFERRKSEVELLQEHLPRQRQAAQK